MMALEQPGLWAARALAAVLTMVAFVIMIGTTAALAHNTAVREAQQNYRYGLTVARSEWGTPVVATVKAVTGRDPDDGAVNATYAWTDKHGGWTIGDWTVSTSAVKKGGKVRLWWWHASYPCYFPYALFVVPLNWSYTPIDIYPMYSKQPDSDDVMFAFIGAWLHAWRLLIMMFFVLLNVLVWLLTAGVRRALTAAQPS